MLVSQIRNETVQHLNNSSILTFYSEYPCAILCPWSFQNLTDNISLKTHSNGGIFIIFSFLYVFVLLQVGQSVHIGGLTRLDVLKSSAQTIYVTVWASSNIPLHLGKTENAGDLRDQHFGIRLQVNLF